MSRPGCNYLNAWESTKPVLTSAECEPFRKNRSEDNSLCLTEQNQKDVKIKSLVPKSPEHLYCLRFTQQHGHKLVQSGGCTSEGMVLIWMWHHTHWHTERMLPAMDSELPSPGSASVLSTCQNERLLTIISYDQGWEIPLYFQEKKYILWVTF